MCGFAGYISFSGSACGKETLSAMGSVLRLRGPDEETFYQDDYLSFVFRRLSIIDLEGGTQPIWNEGKNVFVAVNGEIYNHRELHAKLNHPHEFRTRSDSEIFLHLYEEYGVDALDLLNGMYSIVLWDTSKEVLLLARDRLGIKPLYYAETKNGLLFGSELKALLMHPECPRSLNWADLITPGAQQKTPVSTYINGLWHLPAGHVALYDHSAHLDSRAYWNIADYFSTGTGKNTNTETKYYELIRDSVKKQLMSDVPVGLFLSGGIDSAVIAGLLANESQEVHCFTAVERTTYLSGDVEQARNITRELGLPFHPLLIDVDRMASQFTLADFENLICLIESPRFDPEWYFKSELHRAARYLVPDLKVILIGQGADEFCGGYSKYLGSKHANWDDYLLHLKESINKQVLSDQHIAARFEHELSTDFFLGDTLNVYNQQMKLLTYQLQHFNLWHEDRTSSYHSIEARVPYLDHRLVEFLAAIPESEQEKWFWNKRLIRKVSTKCLRDYPQDHEKVPFFVTDDLHSINKFARSICINIFPDFRLKYIDGEISPFRADALDELYNSLKKGNARSVTAWQLLEHMAICVFQQYCLEPEPFLDQFLNDRKTPLPVVEDDDWDDLEKQFRQSRPASEWTLQSRVTIPDQCEIVNPLTEEEGATALILLCQGAEKYRIRIGDDHEWIVMMLDAMGLYKDEPKDIQFWSEKTGIEPGQIAGVLENLVQGGFLERV